MALERTGLSSVLTFSEKSAVAAMKRASNAYDALYASARNSSKTVIVSANKLRNISQTSKLLGGNIGAVSSAFAAVGSAAPKVGSALSRTGVAASNLGRSLGFAALAAAPVALAMRHGVGEAMAFEDAMKGVEAVTPGEIEGLSGVTAEVRRLGRSTKFNAIEVAGAFEDMRKAGMSMTDSIALGEPVTDLAAAGNVRLADSAELTIKIMKSLGKGVSEAQDVVDKMAISARLFTGDIVDIGTGLSYVSGTARTLGIPLEQLTSAIGAVGEITKEGSRSGTSLNAMLESMGKNAANGALEVGDMAIAFRRTEDGGLDLINTVNDIDVALKKKFKDPMDRVGAITKVFTSRGARAFFALTQQMEKLDEATTASLDNFKGAARAMAETRMNSLTGQFTMLKNALTDLNIAFFGRLLGDLVDPLRSVAKFVREVVTAMEAMTLATDDNSEAAKRIRNDYEKVAPKVRAVGRGLLDAIEMIKRGLNDTLGYLESLGQRFGITFNNDMLSRIVAIGAVVGILVAVLAPLAAIMSIVMIAFGSFVSSIGSAVSGLAAFKYIAIGLKAGVLIAFAKVLLVIAAVIGLAVLAFEAFRNEGESVGEALERLWNDYLVPFGEGFMSVFSVAIKYVKTAFKELSEKIMQAVDAIAFAFDPVIQALTGSGAYATEFGQVMGAVALVAVTALELIARVVVELILRITQLTALVGNTLSVMFVKTIKLIAFNVSELVDGIRMLYSGDIRNGLIKLGVVLVRTLLLPFSQFIRLLFEASETLLGIKIPPSIRQLIEAPEIPALETDVPKKKAENKGEEKKQEGSFMDDLKDALKDVLGKQETTVKTNLNVDGRTVREVTSKFERELGQRAAGKATSWQRRMQSEQAATVL